MTFAYATWHPAGTAPAPTVVALHGHGAHGQDLLGLAPFLAGGRVMLLCPQGEFPVAPVAYTWFHRDGDAQRTVEEFERVASALRAFIEERVPALGGDPERVVLLGFSQGGTLAYRLGLAEPRRWKGVAALSTYFPDDIAGTADREAAGEVPLLVQHGTHDGMIPAARAHASRDLVESLGARPEYREYPMQHEISRESLTDLSDWLTRVLDLGPAAIEL